MLLLKNWDAYARGQAPRWVGSEGALATALLFVSCYSFFPWAALMGFQSRAGKACSRCAKGSCTWVAGEDGCVQCKSKAKGCVDGEAPERWSWGSPVQDFPPSDHFGLGHLERGLRTLGFLSREADEGALGREYARLAWDLRQAWGVVRESPPFLYADGSVIARRSPVPLEGARIVGPAEVLDLEADGVQLALEASRQEGRRQELLVGQSAGAGSSRDVVPEVPREVVEARAPSLVRILTRGLARRSRLRGRSRQRSRSRRRRLERRSRPRKRSRQGSLFRRRTVVLGFCLRRSSRRIHRSRSRRRRVTVRRTRSAGVGSCLTPLAMVSLRTTSWLLRCLSMWIGPGSSESVSRGSFVGWLVLTPPFRSIATDAGDHRGGEGGKRGGREAGKTTARREGGGVTWAALAG